MKRKRLTNKQLTERIIELGALSGADRKHFLDFRSGCNRNLAKALDRIAALEDRPWNPCRTCNGEICDGVKGVPSLRKGIENNWTGDRNPMCYSDEVEEGETDLTCGKCLQSLSNGRLHVLCPYLHEWRKPSDTCHPDLLDTLSRLARDGELRSKR